MSTELCWKVPMQVRYEYSPRLFLFLNKYLAISKVQFYFTSSFIAFRPILHRAAENLVICHSCCSPDGRSRESCDLPPVVPQMGGAVNPVICHLCCSPDGRSRESCDLPPLLFSRWEEQRILWFATPVVLQMGGAGNHVICHLLFPRWEGI